MCICCGDDNCQYGEICAWKNNYVKYYSQSCTASVDGRPAEWEHVIPKAVINKTGCLDVKIMYNQGIVYALDKEAHRNAVHGAGGGITSTGRSLTAQNWANVISDLFNQNQNDEAVSFLIKDEIHAINIFRSNEYRQRSQIIDGMTYISALGAILSKYAGIGLITETSLTENYQWICSELTKHPSEIGY